MTDKDKVKITLTLSRLEVEVLAFLLTQSECILDYAGCNELTGAYCASQPECEDCILCNLISTLRQFKKHPEENKIEHKPCIKIELIKTKTERRKMNL